MDTKTKQAAEIATVVVSIAALAISVYFSRDNSAVSTANLEIARKSLEISAATVDATIKHNERSLRPLLDFQYKFGISSKPEDAGYLKLMNLGEGPAKIISISATFDRKPVETNARQLSELAGTEEFVASALKAGQVVAKGGTVYVYTIAPRAYPSATEACNRDAARKKFAEKLAITVQYESLYSHQQTANFEYIAPIANCRSS